MGKPTVQFVGKGRWGSILLRYFKDSDLFKINPVIFDSKNSVEEIAKCDAECVVIATPQDTQYQIANACLHEGKHIFLEKPGFETGHQGVVLQDLSDTFGGKIFVDYERMFSPALLWLRDHLSLLGEIEGITVRLRKLDLDNKFGVNWSLGTHAYSIISLFCDLTYDVDVNFDLSLKYPYKESEVVIEGTQGIGIFKSGVSKIYLYGDKSWREVDYVFEEYNCLEYAVKYFRKLVDGGVPSNIDLAIQIVLGVLQCQD